MMPDDDDDAVTRPAACRLIWLIPVLAGMVSIYPGLARLTGQDPVGEMLAAHLLSPCGAASEPAWIDPADQRGW